MFLECNVCLFAHEMENNIGKSQKKEYSTETDWLCTQSLQFGNSVSTPEWSQPDFTILFQLKVSSFLLQILCSSILTGALVVSGLVYGRFWFAWCSSQISLRQFLHLTGMGLGLFWTTVL